MKVKVIKNNGILTEGDVLELNSNSNLYELNKTEEDRSENVSTSFSSSYKISEQGIVDNPEYFIFINDDGSEIEKEDNTNLDKNEEIESLKKELEDLKKQIITTSSIPSVFNYHTWNYRKPIFQDFYRPYFTYYW